MTPDKDINLHEKALMDPFPWDEAIGLGLGVLKLSPDEFWRMTPRELALAAKALGFAVPLKRHEFLDLMTRYPDGQSDRQQSIDASE